MGIIHAAVQKQNGHAGNCLLANGDERVQLPCSLALFNPKNHGQFEVSLSGGTSDEMPVTRLCSANGSRTQGGGDVALAMRGGCSFEAKVKAAESMAYRAVVIINAEEEHFPPGGAPDFTSRIPCIMVGHGFLTMLGNMKAKNPITLTIKEGEFCALNAKCQLCSYNHHCHYHHHHQLVRPRENTRQHLTYIPRILPQVYPPLHLPWCGQRIFSQ